MFCHCIQLKRRFELLHSGTNSLQEIDLKIGIPGVHQDAVLIVPYSNIYVQYLILCITLTPTPKQLGKSRNPRSEALKPSTMQFALTTSDKGRCFCYLQLDLVRLTCIQFPNLSIVLFHFRTLPFRI